MAHPYFHAISSARKFGGYAQYYFGIHAFFDSTKAHCHNVRHRALRHSAEGIQLAQELLGTTVFNGVREVPLEQVAVQHITEDCGFVPTTAEWLAQFRPQPWMENIRSVTTQEAAEASARQYGGVPADYMGVHAFLDGIGNEVPTMAIRYHGEGVFLAEAKFGITIANSRGRMIPVRFLAEQQMRMHFRRIPTVADWLSSILLQDWMRTVGETLDRSVEEGSLPLAPLPISRVGI
jgi:hypothetical protein